MSRVWITKHDNVKTLCSKIATGAFHCLVFFKLTEKPSHVAKKLYRLMRKEPWVVDTIILCEVDEDTEEDAERTGSARINALLTTLGNRDKWSRKRAFNALIMPPDEFERYWDQVGRNETGIYTTRVSQI